MIRFLKFAPAIALVALAGAQALAQSSPLSQIVTIDPQPVGSVSSMWSMSSSENGRTIKVESRNGVITAEIDGKPVPADRIVRDANTVKIKDDSGEVIYQTEVPSLDSGSGINTYSIKNRSPFGSNSPTWAANALARGGSPFGLVQIDPDPPKVMIGVQLLEPDSSLRGHLGLKENEATLIGAIYEGLPAAIAGIEPYDIVVAIDGKSPAGPLDIRKALRAIDAGKAVSLDVIHRGQKKSVSITLEKYDREKLDKAKINAIAAATNTPSATTIAGAWPQDPWISQPGTTPMVGIPNNGKPLTLIAPGAGGLDAQVLAEQMREMVARAQQQAEESRRQAEELRRQIGAPNHMQIQMNEMMKRMESMQRLLEQREKSKTEEKSAEGRS